MEFKFSKCGLQFARYPSTVDKWDTVPDSISKEVYEQEIVKLLKAELENVEEVLVFDHTVRSEISDSRPPVYHVLQENTHMIIGDIGVSVHYSLIIRSIR